MGALEQFFSWQTLVLCLAIYVVTYVIRTMVESLWKQASENRFWRELFLPLGGIGNGALFGLLVPRFPWPEMLAGDTLNHIIYGSVCGLFSSFLYNRVKSWLNSKSE
jgi:hypothetical protein